MSMIARACVRVCVRDFLCVCAEEDAELLTRVEAYHGENFSGGIIVILFFCIYLLEGWCRRSIKRLGLPVEILFICSILVCECVSQSVSVRVRMLLLLSMLYNQVESKDAQRDILKIVWSVFVA